MPDLLRVTDKRIDEPLASWREYRTKGRIAHKMQLPERIRELASSVDELFGWTDQRAAASAAPRKVPGSAPSAGGPAGLLQLAEAVGRGQMDPQIAQNAAAGLDVADDDVVFLTAFCGKDPDYRDGATAGAIMLLGGAIVRDDALGGKLLRTLAALGKDRQQQYALLQKAEARLAGGADDSLRAEVWNELAILLGSAGQNEAAATLAAAARELATTVGAHHVASMALGNMAWLLMQERRWSKAVELFEQLEEEQRLAGDSRGLDITRANLEACRQQM
jgi:tetratricopeptide (TPR) repeat protein